MAYLRDEAGRSLSSTSWMAITVVRGGKTN
jgi:hypothetical protein